MYKYVLFLPISKLVTGLIGRVFNKSLCICYGLKTTSPRREEVPLLKVLGCPEAQGT